MVAVGEPVHVMLRDAARVAAGQVSLVDAGSDGEDGRGHRHRRWMRPNPGRKKGVDSWKNRRTPRRRIGQVRLIIS